VDPVSATPCVVRKRRICVHGASPLRRLFSCRAERTEGCPSGTRTRGTAGSAENHGSHHSDDEYDANCPLEGPQTPHASTLCEYLSSRWSACKSAVHLEHVRESYPPVCFLHLVPASCPGDGRAAPKSPSDLIIEIEISADVHLRPTSGFFELGRNSCRNTTSGSGL
jgi:hypothetical protein